LYEGILLEYSFSPLFVSKLLGRYSFLDELSSLDAELHRNLVYLKVSHPCNIPSCEKLFAYM
jgi:ubiquitin-protein ligase E3 B